MNSGSELFLLAGVIIVLLLACCYIASRGFQYYLKQEADGVSYGRMRRLALYPCMAWLPLLTVVFINVRISSMLSEALDILIVLLGVVHFFISFFCVGFAWRMAHSRKPFYAVALLDGLCSLLYLLPILSVFLKAVYD